LPGDFNQDGIVNAADYVTWKNGLGTAYTQGDYDIWRTHFGQTLSAGMATSRTVPETSPWTIGLIGVAALCANRKSNRHSS
jgi:hypothetical protein